MERAGRDAHAVATDADPVPEVEARNLLAVQEDAESLPCQAGDVCHLDVEFATEFEYAAPVIHRRRSVARRRASGRVP